MDITFQMIEGVAGYEIEWVSSDKKATEVGEDQYWDLLEYSYRVYDNLEEAKAELIKRASYYSPVDYGTIKEVYYEWIDGIPYGWSYQNEDHTPILYYEDLV